jgi:hypothetical protein
MNLEILSTNKKTITIEGDYYPDDRLVDVINIVYSIAGGSGDYDVEVTDEDSANPNTSVLSSVVGNCVVQLADNKNSFDSGITSIVGNIDLLITDNDTSESENLDVDFEFIVDNQGTFQELLPLKAEYTNLNIATSYSRDSDVTELGRKANVVVSSSGGSGQTRILWNVDDFQHPNLRVDGSLTEKIVGVQFNFGVDEIPDSILDDENSNDYALSGAFRFSLIDELTNEFIDDQVDWSFKVSVLAQKEESDFRETSRVVPGRFRVRNPEDNRWFDMCYDEMYIYDDSRRNWLRLFPGKVFVRDANNLDWVSITCVNDPTYDDPCDNIYSDSCIGNVGDPFAGSGDGKGSGGPDFDLLSGYPEGYDLPDSFLGGFGVKTAGASYDSRFLQTGFIIQRPGILSQESYDPRGINQDDDNLGDWLNPNVIGASTWSRGAAVTESIYELGDQDGWFELQYAAYDSVSIDVYYLGERIATTCGQVPESTRGPLSFYIALGKNNGHNKILVRVRGKESCEWAYKISNPTKSQVFPDFDPYDETLYGKIDSSVFNEPDLIRMHYLGTPAMPAPCRATVGNINIERQLVFPLHERMDNKNFFEFYHYAGNQQGTLHLDYTSWQNADKIEIYHAGVRIATNYDPKQIAGTIAIPYDPTRTSVFDIVVRVYTRTLQEGDPLKTWYYSLYCIDEPGYRDLPWDCRAEDQAATTDNIVKDSLVASMGSFCMEDNINIDNNLNQGVFKVKFVDTSSKCYVTLFNEDGAVIPTFDATSNTFVTTATVEGSVELDYFNFNQDTAQTYKKIYVRVESDLASTWEYYVTCPVPLLDIVLDPIDVAAGISIEDTFVLSGNAGGSTFIVAEAPVNNDVLVEYTMLDGTATNLNDYCAVTGSVTIPAGSDRVELPFSLAPCGDVPLPVGGAEWLTRPFKSVVDNATGTSDALAGILVGSGFSVETTSTETMTGIKNYSPIKDVIVFETEPNAAPIDQTIENGSRTARARVTSEGLQDWRITAVSGADPEISTEGWTTDNVSANASVDAGSSGPGLSRCGVRVEFRYNDGTILSQDITLAASAETNESGNGGGGGIGCPSFNTPITLVDKSIKLAGNLELGDKLLGCTYGGDSLNWTSTEAEFKLTSVYVQNINIFTAHHWIEVNGFEFTDDHPFLVNRKGLWSWVDAQSLVSSDLILNSKFQVMQIESLRKATGTLKFIRLDVSDPDTFFAGDLLSHNKELRSAE